MSRLKEKIKDFESEMNDLVSINQVYSKLVTLIGDHERRSKKLFTDLNKTKTSLEKIEIVAQEVNNLPQVINDNVRDINDSITSKSLNTLQSFTKELSKEKKKELDKLALHLEENERLLNERIEKVSTKLTEMHSIPSKIAKEYTSAISQHSEELDTLNSKFNRSITSQLTHYKKKNDLLIESFHQVIMDLSKEVSSFSTTVESSSNNVEKKVDEELLSFSESIEDQIKNIDKKIASSTEKGIDKILTKISKVETELHDRIEILKNTANDYAVLPDEIKNNIENITNEEVSSFKNVKKTLIEEFGNLITSLLTSQAESINQFKDTFTVSLSKIDTASDKIVNIPSMIENDLEKLFSTLMQQQNTLWLSIERSFINTINEIQKNADEVNQKVEFNLNKLVDSLNVISKQEESIQEMKSVLNNLTQEVNSIKEQLRNFQQNNILQLREANVDLENYIDKNITKAINQFKNDNDMKLQQMKTELSNFINEKNEENEGKLDEILVLLTQKKKSWWG